MPNVFGGLVNKARNAIDNWWKTSVEGAPPSIRFLDIAYVKLVRRKGKKTVDVGSFIPELYELASTPKGSLICQMEENAWADKKWRNKRAPAKTSRTYTAALQKENPELYAKLYRTNGERKSAFELSVIPSHRVSDVEHVVKTEYKYRRDRRLPMPAMISKFRVMPDYLNKLSDAGLEAKEFPTGIKVNIKNPVSVMGLTEKLLHYSGQWASWMVTIAAALVTGMALGGSPAIMALSIVASYLAKKCANDFGFYDTAEALFRDIGWFTSKELSWRGKLSFTKSVETMIYLAAIGLSIYLGATGMWAMAFELPWTWLSNLGVTTAFSTVQTGLAGFFAVAGALSSYAAATFTIRYFWGLSFYDNDIQFTKDMGKHLPVVESKKGAATSLKRSLDQTMRRIEKHVPDRKERKKLVDDLSNAFKPFIKQYEEKAKAANDPHQNVHHRPKRKNRA